MEVEGYQQTPESIPMKMEYGKELILYGPYLYHSWILVDRRNLAWRTTNPIGMAQIQDL